MSIDKAHKRVELVNEYVAKLELSEEIQKYYLGKTILVTGGAGAIGSNLIIGLSNLVGGKGKIVVIDNLSSIKVNSTENIMPLDNILFVEGDITNE